MIPGVNRSGRNMVLIEDAISLFVKGRYAHEEYTTVVEGAGKGKR